MPTDRISALIHGRSSPASMANNDFPHRSDPRALEQVAGEYGLRAVALESIDHGLINRTWRVRASDGESYALQRLSAILGAEVHPDIEAVSAHIAAKGMPTPRLLRTAGGDLCVKREDGIWRMLTWLEGEFRNRLESAAQAAQAGALLARFHCALDDFDQPFASQRRPIHEPSRRFAELDRALAGHPDHPLRAEADALRRRTLAIAAGLPPMPRTPLRVAHGDPKINNMLFTPEGEGLAMVDLDSLGRLSLPYELGDAFRSWCNPAGEDSEDTAFSAELFEAARTGYLEVASFVTEEERSSLVDATLWITLELASRFAADILNNRYFGWNPKRFASRAEHNLVRARGQLRLAESLLKQRPILAA
ncbi:MAG: phosphotransferase [Gammaproteobacteria bacterium]|nr:phosphotransferase [Gammaproteobacteria bacterium]